MWKKKIKWLSPWLGTLLGLLTLIWILRDFNLDRFLKILTGVNYLPLTLIPVFIILEQIFRAIKWRQLLYPLHSFNILHLFGATMIGYFSNLVTPVRVSPLVRGWIIARCGKLRVASVLATITFDRVSDGLVFIGFTVMTILFFRFPDQEEAVKAGMSWGALASLILFVLLISVILALKYAPRKEYTWLRWASGWLPTRVNQFLKDFFQSFLDGAVLPKEAWRQGLIILCAIVIKLIAVSYFFWVGLAFNITLSYLDCLFLMVFLGYIVVLAGTLRIVGSFSAGTIFVLKGFGVEVETALAMALILQILTQLTIVGTACVAYWTMGIKISDISDNGVAS